jgi:hypothetical protein
MFSRRSQSRCQSRLWRNDMDCRDLPPIRRLTAEPNPCSTENSRLEFTRRATLQHACPGDQTHGTALKAGTSFPVFSIPRCAAGVRIKPTRGHAQCSLGRAGMTYVLLYSSFSHVHLAEGSPQPEQTPSSMGAPQVLHGVQPHVWHIVSTPKTSYVTDFGREESTSRPRVRALCVSGRKSYASESHCRTSRRE